MILSAALSEFRPGRKIILPGGPAELLDLQEALTAEPDRLQDVELVCPMIPGMNRFDYTALNPTVTLTTFMVPPELKDGFRRRQVQVLPLPYSQIARYLISLCADVAFLHLCRREDGQLTFGASADFGPLAARTAARRIGVVNTAMPAPRMSPTIDAATLDSLMEIHRPLLSSTPKRGPAAELNMLALSVAELIPNGAAVQTGIGSAPDAIWNALASHRALRLRTGIVTDAVLGALDAGALAEAGHLSGIAFGSAQLYDRLNGSNSIRFSCVSETHETALTDLERFFAINSALEVDLFGQVNVEWQAGRFRSGVGGAPDFMAAARRSEGGKAIIAVPATARKGQVSRIVSRLSVPASLSRSEVDVVATENGVADLRHLSLDERANALIAIAAPEFRESLDIEWRALRATI